MLLASGAYSKLIGVWVGDALTCAGRVYSAKDEGLWHGAGWLLVGMEHGQLQPGHLCPVPRAGVHVMHLGQDLAPADYGDCFTYISAGREDSLLG